MQYFIRVQDYNNEYNWYKQVGKYTQLIPVKQTIQVVREAHKLTKERPSGCKCYGRQQKTSISL